ncbi:MAG: hypothetical protein HQ567_06515 [Candidatus Nealsonbacteria bacterium]|nr:hypothetical protein [Candidatus Nealsonbacteria bacterium]
MWQWSEHLKLGKSAAFVKRDLRRLPLTEAEFEADFFLDPEFSSKRQERWMGMVIEREFGDVLAMEDVRLPPPTVNALASLLSQAMLRPLNEGERQRPNTVYLRDRPQWQELLPHLQQLGMAVVTGDELPRFDEAVVEWMQQTKTDRKPPSADEIKAALNRPFPARKRTRHEAAMTLLEWTDGMLKGAYPKRHAPVPSYDPMTTVSIHLTAEELRAIITETDIAKTKKLRPRLEAVVEAERVDLSVDEWGTVCFALCGVRAKGVRVGKHLLRIAIKIANRLAEALDIDGPATWLEKKCR